MHPRRLATLVALIGGIVACGDSTGPASRLGVTLSVDGQPHVAESVSSDGQLSIRCDVSLIASARNRGTATWADGIIRFYFGRDRTVAADSVALSVTDVQEVWGKQFNSDVVSRSDWYASAGAPFDAEFEFRFADGVAPAKTRFTCGPPLVATNELPSVTSLSVLPASGTVQAGDTLRITYSASAPGTLWSTTVQVAGPFGFHQQYAEHGAGSTTRTVKVAVPPSAFFNVPIVVNVAATDPALQWRDSTVQTPLTVVDQTPPVVRNAYFPFFGPAGAEFFAGDTIQLSVDAYDNNSLAWVVWDVTGAVTVHDSVHAPVGMTSGVVPVLLGISPAWEGTSTISAYVRDGTGAPSAARTAGSVHVSPTYEYPVSAVATAPASSSYGMLNDVAFDAKRGRLYITIGNTNDVQVLDVATATFGTSIPLPSPGAGLDLSASGDSLIVAEPDTKSLAVVNLAEPGTAPVIVPLTVLDTAGEQASGVSPRPVGVRVAANGNAIVQLVYRTASGDGVLSVDLNSGTQRVRSDGQPKVTPLVQMMGATPDRSRIVIFDPLCPRTYVPATDAFTSCAVPQSEYGFPLMSFDAAGERFALGNSVFDLSFNRLDVAGNISGVSALSPDGTVLYLVASDHVVMQRVVDGVVLGRFSVPFVPQEMVMAPGGEWLIVSRRDDVVKAARVNLP